VVLDVLFLTLQGRNLVNEGNTIESNKRHTDEHGRLFFRPLI